MRWAIAGYLAAGAVALLLLDAGHEGAFYAGCILLLTILISVGIHLVMATVVLERSEHTLPFVMSLPISPREYTAAKILANMLIFLVPWAALLIGSVMIIAMASGHDGVIPFVIVVLTELFVSYCLILAVAIMSESQGWTIGAMVFGNLSLQAFLYLVSHIPSVASANNSPTMIWNQPTVTILLAEIAAIVLLLALTFRVQGRKRDFV
jgi:ABC-type transport system involved in multi-copper enzyme maturation permease subunit